MPPTKPAEQPTTAFVDASDELLGGAGGPDAAAAAGGTRTADLTCSYCLCMLQEAASDSDSESGLGDNSEVGRGLHCGCYKHSWIY